MDSGSNEGGVQGSEDDGAFFTPVGDTLVPEARARGSWSRAHLHGRLIAGLLARGLERDPASGAGDGLMCSRMTIDLFRPAPMSAVRVEVETVRAGRRLRVLDAHAYAGGLEVARAAAVMLATSEDPPGAVWSAPGWSMPPAEELMAIPEGERAKLPWDLRRAGPDTLATAERTQVWVRDRHRLVRGETPSALVRVASVADAANPMANAGSRGLRYINADITLHLRRYPAGEWIGFEATGHLGEAGVAVGLCTLYDEGGPVGYATVCALANGSLGRRLRAQGS
jgi:hypothetical protein